MFVTNNLFYKFWFTFKQKKITFWKKKIFLLNITNITNNYIKDIGHHFSVHDHHHHHHCRLH